MKKNTAILGEYYMEQLAEIPSSHVKEMRGNGLMIGVEQKLRQVGRDDFRRRFRARNIS